MSLGTYLTSVLQLGSIRLESFWSWVFFLRKTFSRKEHQENSFFPLSLCLCSLSSSLPHFSTTPPYSKRSLLLNNHMKSPLSMWEYCQRLRFKWLALVHATSFRACKGCSPSLHWASAGAAPPASRQMLQFLQPAQGAKSWHIRLQKGDMIL